MLRIIKLVPVLCSCTPGHARSAAGSQLLTQPVQLDVQYSCTKWTGEVLMRQACEQLGLPVTAYRCAMILAHSRSALYLPPFDPSRLPNL